MFAEVNNRTPAIIRVFFFISFATIWVVANSCSSNSAVNTPLPSATTSLLLPHSMKGYELYSWQAKDQWHFTLMTGTNRVKSYEEITSNESISTTGGLTKISAQNVDGIKSILGRLPQHEEIVWVGEQQLQQAGIQTGRITLPPREIIDDIKEYIRQLGLELKVDN